MKYMFYGLATIVVVTMVWCLIAIVVALAPVPPNTRQFCEQKGGEITVGTSLTFHRFYECRIVFLNSYHSYNWTTTNGTTTFETL